MAVLVTSVLWSDMHLAKTVSWFGTLGWHHWTNTFNIVIDGNLTTICYCDKFIQAHVIPFVQCQQRPITLQQDDTRPHVARVVRDFLAQQNIDVLQWPTVSLDLAPIKHVWDEMEHCVCVLTTSRVVGSFASDVSPYLEWQNYFHRHSSTIW